MEYKKISSKFMLQTQTKYKNTKIQTCLQGLLLWDMSKIVFRQSALLPKFKH